MKNYLAIFILFISFCSSAQAINLWGNTSTSPFGNFFYPNNYNFWNRYPTQNYRNYYQNQYNHSVWSNFKRKPHFGNYGGMTGYSIPITNPNLQNCSSNSYYVDNYGVVQCSKTTDGSATVHIIQD